MGIARAVRGPRFLRLRTVLCDTAELLWRCGVRGEFTRVGVDCNEDSWPFTDGVPGRGAA
jgi:hypothetical protein